MKKLESQDKVRLAKFISACGISSRRQAELLILEGRVKLNGKIVKEVATKIDPQIDKVTVNDEVLKFEEKVYYLLNKPIGFLSSAKDPHHKQMVTDLVPKKYKVWPVGRLDKDSRGLLLLTNDGDLTYLLTHPKHTVQKVYQIELNDKITPALLVALKKGVRLEEGLAKVDSVKKIADNKLEIVIHQGWKRQIRRMLAVLDYQVIDLLRLQEGKLSLKDLAPGKYKILSKEDIV